MRTPAPRIPALVEKAVMAVVLALIVAIVLALPALPFLAGVGADSLIARFSGCGLSTMTREITAWPALMQTLVLLTRWLLYTLFVLLSLLWLMAMLIFTTSAVNERGRERLTAWLTYSSTGLVALGVVVPVYGQMVCLAA